MFIKLPNILDQGKLKNINKILSQASFIDGKLSAGSAAKKVKTNLELDQNSQQAAYLDELVVSSLSQNLMFRNATLPHKVSQPFFAKYEKGMSYGDHIDDPVTGNWPERYRTDVAVTVFLSGPEDYEGGELVVNTSFGQTSTKLPAGDAVCYPASSLHHVSEVTKGVRLVAVLWIQSLVRDPAKRELLYELSLAREKMLAQAPGAEETAQIDHTYTNLVRMWSEV
ncbi:MAG: Fe2+-dependent dioxygenase [Acidiferrobacterales bacterium]